MNTGIPRNSCVWPFPFDCVYSGCSDAAPSDNNEIELIVVEAAVHHDEVVGGECEKLLLELRRRGISGESSGLP